MIRKEEVYKIGVLNKPHGIHGELQFSFNDDIFDRVDLDYLICLIDGIFVPFFIEEYRFRAENSALIKFEGIDSAEQARRFTNVEVYFPIKYVEEDEDISLSFLVGFSVIANGGVVLGEITEIDESTINTLFVVEKEGNTVFIPAQDEFVVDIDRENKKITLELPEGLIELNS